MPHLCKGVFGEYPEFAHNMDVFCELISRLDHPHFGVNCDPSNAFLAGDDPLELLDRVKHRVVTMHASDRYLLSGTLEDLRNEDGVDGMDQLAASVKFVRGKMAHYWPRA